MPKVNGTEFPYTAKGRKDADAARKKRKRGPGGSAKDLSRELFERKRSYKK